MPTFERKKMCSECPFRQKSIKGWLGPWTAEEVEKMVRHDGVFICHTEISEMMEEGYSEDEIQETGQHCVGMLRYRNTTCKLSADPETYAAQIELRQIEDEKLIPPHKFVEHHTLILPKKKKKKSK